MHARPPAQQNYSPRPTTNRGRGLSGYRPLPTMRLSLLLARSMTARPRPLPLRNYATMCPFTSAGEIEP
jgi:hypothetical protein